MFRQSFDFRGLGALFILVSVYIGVWVHGNTGCASISVDQKKYFLRLNGEQLELVDSHPTLDSSAIPAALRPLFFEKIPINRASTELLTTIPGIGPEMASRIVATREDTGGFDTPEDLVRVPGIGSKRKQYLKDFLSFED